MKPLWKPYVSWSDCLSLTQMMNKLQDQIVQGLSYGKQESGILNDDSGIRVALIDIQKTIERIRVKDTPKELDRNVHYENLINSGLLTLNEVRKLKNDTTK